MESLQIATHYLTIYSFFIILVLGIFGSVCNLITFSYTEFRTHSCTFYLICSSSMELIFITYGIIIRLATEYLGDNLMNTNRGICKVRSYFAVCLPTMASMCVFLAAFDRCNSISPSTRWRRLSSFSVARILTFVMVMVFVPVSSCFHLILFDIRNSKCEVMAGWQTITVSLYAALITVLLPHGGMLIFGIITWYRIIKLRNRVVSISAVSVYTRNIQWKNQQLIILTFMHASFSIIFVTIRFVGYAYNIITSSVPKSADRQILEYFLQQVSIIIYYINYSMPFYIYYTSGRLFRREFRKSILHLLKKFICCCKCF